MFELCYQMHGGSGLNVTYADVMDMELDTIIDWSQRLKTTREEESKNLRKSGAAARGVNLIT